MDRRQALAALCAAVLAPGRLLARPPPAKLVPFLGTDWTVTVKDGLVPDDKIYRFSDPVFIGTGYVAVDDRLVKIFDSKISQELLPIDDRTHEVMYGYPRVDPRRCVVESWHETTDENGVVTEHVQLRFDPSL